MNRFKRPPVLTNQSNARLEYTGFAPSVSKNAADLIAHYAKKSRKKSSALLGLSDATGSMDSVWNGTRHHITEMIRRTQELLANDGSFQMKWVAYRDYEDGNALLETSAWCTQATELLPFVNGISCFGGGDFPEAVERALAFAADDSIATRILLIGDAPPHEERDYRDQAHRLTQLKRPVFSFVVGDHPETIRCFSEISQITGGKFTRLTSAEDLLDCVVLTVADELGGRDLILEYKNRFPHLSEGGRQYAKLLLEDQSAG